MKNYLYHFEFFSGLYESYFYQQVKAKNEKDAIIQIVGYFKNITEVDAENFLNKELQNKWTTKTFWDKIDLRFSNDSEGYTLIWIKEIDFDLNNVGKII